MAKKPNKNDKPQKKIPNIPGLPKDANVKVIEITPKTFLVPLFFLVFAWAIYSTWTGYTSEKVAYNDTIGLNEIQAQYQS